ncbi:flavin reductase family protein [Rhizobiaceae bacterium]|nr:flavin reductase family protein [Rhizobiaceae bacterium]
MTGFDFADLTPTERYKMLCAAVVPRPIAWITSIDDIGTVNAAPYSFFNVFSEDPALVIVGMNRKADGDRKDSLNNIEASGVFTVNIADAAQAEALVATASAYPAGTGEPTALGLRLAAAHSNGVPHLAACPIALECTLFECRALGPERHLVMGEVVALVARDGLFDPDTLRIDPDGFAPLARLHGTSYAGLGPRFDVSIPAVPKEFE